jgi:hypothetical protein
LRRESVLSKIFLLPFTLSHKREWAITRIVKPGRAAYKWQEVTETSMKIRELAQAGFLLDLWKKSVSRKL